MYSFDAEARNELAGLARILSNAYGHLRDKMTDRGSGPVNETYPEPYGPAAGKSLDGFGGQYMVLSTLYDMASTVDSTYAASLDSVRVALHDRVAEADGGGLTVDVTSGAVSIAPRKTTPDMSGLSQFRSWILDEFAALIARADKIDADAQQDYTRIWNGLTQGDSEISKQFPDLGDETGIDGLGVRTANDDLDLMRDAMPGPNATPEQIVEWWADLDPLTRQQFELAVPIDLYQLLNRVPSSRRSPDMSDAMSQMTGLASNGYDAVATVKWVYDNHNTYGADTSSLPATVNNGEWCTVFASTALAAGGGLPYNGNVWYAGGPLQWAGMPGASESFYSAQRSYDYFTQHGSEIATTSNGANPPYGTVKPGDIAYFQVPSVGVFHTAIVTAVLPDGDVLYTQQSEPMLNGDMNVRGQHVAEAQGDFTTTFVRPKRDW